jgi:hypothetical protein
LCIITDTVFLALHSENAKSMVRLALERDELLFVIAVSAIVLLIKCVLLAMCVPVRAALEQAAAGGAAGGFGGSSVREDLTESLTTDTAEEASSSGSHASGTAGGGGGGSGLPKVMSFIGGDGNMWVKAVSILVTCQMAVSILSSVGLSDYRDDVSPVALLLCFFGLHTKHKQSLLVFGAALFWFFFTDLIVSV